MNEQKKDRRLKFLLHTNAPWTHSGYGIEARDLMRRFKSDGWEAGMIAFSGHEGSPIEFEGYPVYGKMGEAFGTDAMYFHSKHYGANVVFSFLDVWTLNPQFLQMMQQEGRIFIPYVPIDSDPIPPNVLANLRYANRIITFSEWGQKTLQKHGFTSSLILEGTDTNIFKPMDRMEFRRMFNISDKTFVIGMVGANKENPPRKAWQQALEAFKRFHDNHPDSLFWFECNQESPGGFPIRQYAQYLGIDKQLRSLDTYMSVFHAGSDIMAKLYSMFDVLSHASATEGFGLCQIEALACGIPVIATDYSAMTEVVQEGKTGFLCKTGFEYFNNALSFYKYPDPISLYECYEKVFSANRVQMGFECRKSVLAKYDINKIYEDKWRLYLESLQEELLGKIDTNPKNE